ncbi:MAG: hypothetical protein VB934_21380 [Polyangiaceae bacterium]
MENTAKSETTTIRRGRVIGQYAVLVLHWIIILNFAIEIIYGSYMVFVVVVPDNVTGPLFEAAKNMDVGLMTTRRLYALEVWVATAGLAIYLAITEIAPRLKLMRKVDAD